MTARLALAFTLLVAAAVLLGVPRAARAAGDRDTAKAAEHFSLAEAAEKRGDWATAIYEYKAAHALKPHPSVLYNIAVNYEKLGDWDNAADYFQKYLDDSGDAPDRAEVEARIAENRRKGDEQRRAAPRPGAGVGRLSVHANVAGATVRIDGQVVGVTPLDIAVPAGAHRIDIEHPGHAPARRDVTVAAGGREEIREYLSPVAGAGGGSDDDSGAPRTPRWSIALMSGTALTESAFRGGLGLGLRPSRHFELGAYWGYLGRNDRGFGVEARWLLGRATLKPAVRGAVTLGSADHGNDTFRTFGAEGGVGIIYTMAFGPPATAAAPGQPPPPAPRLAIEYYLELNGRYTAGGVGKEVDGMTTLEDDRTVPFQLSVDFAIAVRF
jgi:tetratricopeptide (TPR) repeat protein